MSIQEQFHGQETVADDPSDLAQMYRHIDQVYTERTRLTALVMRLCRELGYTVGMGKDGAPVEPAWDNVAFFDLPSGQCSFHIALWDMHFFEGLPAYPGEWDGHTPEEKWHRIEQPQLEPWFMREWGTKNNLGDTFKTAPYRIEHNDEEIG